MGRPVEYAVYFLPDPLDEAVLLFGGDEGHPANGELVVAVVQDVGPAGAGDDFVGEAFGNANPAVVRHEFPVSAPGKGTGQTDDPGEVDLLLVIHTLQTILAMLQRSSRSTGARCYVPSMSSTT